jgi:uncharacterized protein YcbX
MPDKAAMAKLTKPRVAALYRYPVKGLSGERLAAVELAAGATFPFDRAFALENGPSGFDPAAPAWQPKIKFLCLMKNARLAALQTRYDDQSGMFSIVQNGRTLVEAPLDQAEGRAAIEKFFAGYMGGEARGTIRLLRAPGHSFSDLADKVVSIINLGTLADLGRAVGRVVHPLRFRANLYAEGIPPWSELEWIGRTLVIGAARLRVVKATERCAATEVNPENAERDIDVPDGLWRLRGAADCGIYAEVIAAGRIAEGDPLRLAG